MEFRLDILPAGDTTPAEIDQLTQMLRGALDRAHEVDSVATVRQAAPEGAKGVVDVLGALILGIPAGAITGVLDIIKTIAGRQPQSLTLKMTADGGIEASFDPKTVTPERFAALVEQLKSGLAAKPPPPSPSPA